MDLISRRSVIDAIEQAFYRADVTPIEVTKRYLLSLIEQIDKTE